jgi:hypothetical protein
MNAAEMIELRSRKPFTPFKIRLQDGSSIRVEHPYVVSTRPDSPSCVVHEDEHMHIVAYRDISEVVMAPFNGAQQSPLQ